MCLHEDVFIYYSKMRISTRSSIRFFHFLIPRYGRKFGSSYHEYLLMKSIPPVYINTSKSFRTVGLVSTEKNAKNHRTAVAPSERLHLFKTSVKNDNPYKSIRKNQCKEEKPNLHVLPGTKCEIPPSYTRGSFLCNLNHCTCVVPLAGLTL